MNDSQRKTAQRLLSGKIDHPKNDYQRGWNDALQAAADVEIGNIPIEVLTGNGEREEDT